MRPALPSRLNFSGVDMYCKDCEYWRKEEKECHRIDWGDQYANPKPGEAHYYADASDDYGLCAGLVTSPTFGCVMFAEKKAER